MSHLSNTWLVWRQGLVEILVYVPLLLLVPYLTDASNMESVIWLLLLSICYPLGYGVESILSTKTLLWRGLLTIIVVIAYALVIPFTGWSLYLFAALGVLAARRGAGMRQRPWRQLFPIVHFWIGLFLYFATSFVFPRLESMEPLSDLLWYFGGITLVLTVILANRRSIKEASLPGKQQEGNVSKEMSFRNTVLLILLLAIVILIGSLRYIQAAVVSVLDWFKDLIRRWFESSEPVDILEQNQMPGMSPPSFLERETTEPSPFLDFLQQMLFYVIIGLLGVAALFLLFLLGKGMVKLWGIVKNWLMSRGMEWDRTEKTGYVDEKESLIDLNKIRHDLADKWRSMFTRSREPKWEDLATNEERVRFLYRYVLQQMKKEGYAPTPDLSPSETLQEAVKWMERSDHHIEGLKQVDILLLENYYRARYSENKVTDKEVETLRNRIVM